MYVQDNYNGAVVVGLGQANYEVGMHKKSIDSSKYLFDETISLGIHRRFF